MDGTDEGLTVGNVSRTMGAAVRGIEKLRAGMDMDMERSYSPTILCIKLQ